MEQLRVFMERQKTIPNLHAQWALKIADCIPYEESKKECVRGNELKQWVPIPSRILTGIKVPHL
jgi:hypothetical protein